MTASFQRFSGVCGVLSGLAGLLYLAFFFIYKNPAALLPALALLMVGLLALPLVVGLFQLLRTIDEGFAVLGLLFGVAGALGASVHAAFDLANALHPPAAAFGYPSPVDPRGFLTFVAAGLSILFLSGLITASGLLPRSLGYLGWASGIVLVVLYLAYLTTLNATNPLVLALIVAAGVLQPVWYLWAGWRLARGEGELRRRTVPGSRR